VKVGFGVFQPVQFTPIERCANDLDSPRFGEFFNSPNRTSEESWFSDFSGRTIQVFSVRCEGIL